MSMDNFRLVPVRTKTLGSATIDHDGLALGSVVCNGIPWTRRGEGGKGSTNVPRLVSPRDGVNKPKGIVEPAAPLPFGPSYWHPCGITTSSWVEPKAQLGKGGE